MTSQFKVFSDIGVQTKCYSSFSEKTAREIAEIG